MFMPAIHYHPDVVDWVGRVVAAPAGPVPSYKSLSVSDEFCVTSVLWGLNPKLKQINLICPDSQTAAITPLVNRIVTAGHPRWDASGTQDLSIDGLKGNGVNTSYVSWVNSSTDFTATSISMFIYTHYQRNETLPSFSSRINASVTCNIFVSWGATGGLTGETYFDTFNETVAQGRIFASNPAWQGYICGSRVNTVKSIFKGNSAVAHTTLNSTVGTGGSRPNIAMNVMSNAGVPMGFSTSRYSVVGSSQGLTFGESGLMFLLCQRAREQFGGGYH